MDYPAILQAVMDRGKLTQDELASRLSVSQPTISRWLKGAKPKVDQHERIISEASRLGLIGEREPEGAPVGVPPMVRVQGYVGAGAEAHYYAVSQGDLDEVPAPDGATDATVAVEIRGSSLGALFDRWLIFYDDVRRPITSDLIGKLCVVGLASGQILVKKIQRGRSKGLFTLVSAAGEPPIEDAVIEWAARVINMAPQ